jgi:hypothetical protein
MCYYQGLKLVTKKVCQSSVTLVETFVPLMPQIMLQIEALAMEIFSIDNSKFRW